MTNIGKLVNK